MTKYDLEYWRNRALLAEALLVPATSVPSEWQLSAKEHAVVSVLADGEVHKFTDIADRIYFNHDGPSDLDSTIKVFVYRIRRKLLPFGVRVRNVWGQGYCLVGWGENAEGPQAKEDAT